MRVRREGKRKMERFIFERKRKKEINLLKRRIEEDEMAEKKQGVNLYHIRKVEEGEKGKK